MNHGGIGYVDYDHFQFPIGVLEPLSIEGESSLYGLYYPKLKTKDYKNVRYPHDFMLTPLPPRFWPRVGRIKIRLKHEPQALSTVSSFLAENGVNIITAECNRSTHRAANWLATVCFEELADDLHFDDTRSVYSETYEALEELVEKIEKHCKDVLFKAINDIDLKNAVEPLPVTALAYFHNQLVERTKKGGKSELLYGKLEFNLSDGRIVCNREKRIRRIYDHAFKDEAELPSIALVDSYIRDMNLRTVIIPRSMLNRFFECTIHYERLSRPDSSRGLLASITKSLPAYYDLWRVSNHTQENEKDSESGRICCIIENINEKATGDNFAAQLKGDFKKIKAKVEKDLHCIAIDSVDIEPVSLDHVQETIEIERLSSLVPTKSLFVSYARADSEVAVKLKSWLDGENIPHFIDRDRLGGGDPFDEQIRKSILESKEMCVLFTENTKDSTWVMRELGAAWVLGKRITPILSGVKTESLPRFLREKHYAINLDDRDKMKEFIKNLKQDGSIIL